MEISPFTINLNNQLTKLVRTMTKADIVEIISQSTGITKVETEAVVKGFLDTIIDAMKKGENIELRGQFIDELMQEIQFAIVVLGC